MARTMAAAVVLCTIAAVVHAAPYVRERGATGPGLWVDPAQAIYQNSKNLMNLNALQAPSDVSANAPGVAAFTDRNHPMAELIKATQERLQAGEVASAVGAGGASRRDWLDYYAAELPPTAPEEVETAAASANNANDTNITNTNNTNDTNTTDLNITEPEPIDPANPAYAKGREGESSCRGWGLEGESSTKNSPGWCVEGDVGNDETCTTACKEGLQPSIPVLACKNGRFYPDGFHCEVPRCKVPLVANMHTERCVEEGHGIDGVPVGGECHVKCADEYVSVPTVITCDPSTGAGLAPVLSDTPHCLGVVGRCDVDPPADMNIDISKCPRKLDLLQNCTTRCNDGYVPKEWNTKENEDVVSCGKDGTIYPTELECNPAFCEMPLKLGYNVVPGESKGCYPGTRLSHGSYCTVQCAPGFKKESSDDRDMAVCSKGHVHMPDITCVFDESYKA